MKHIVIDARLYGPKHTGIGRYTKNLIQSIKLNPDFKKHKYTLVIYQDLAAEIKTDLGNDFNYFITTIPHYSLKEQLLMPIVLYRMKADLVHFTNFNKPVFYFGKSVVTIHDLIKHFFKSKDTTTRNPFFYWIKHLAYLLLTKITIKTSDIIVPSNFWRNYLIKNFNVSSKKITTTYEAVDPNFSKIISKPVIKPKNYILYTGNLYPHKNIKIILNALKSLPQLNLKIISARSFFTDKIKVLVNQYNLNEQVEFLGYISDKDFKDIYQNALALVHPSLMEGFSLTGLEAMALNCPVISSNSSCLPEIYGNSVLYFNPNNTKELITQVNKLQKSLNLRKKLIELGHQQLTKYSWQQTAVKTIQVYENILNERT